MLLPFQPYDALPSVLASADVVLTILEPNAGIFFQVPSKVVTYHCAGRPLLAAVPHENLAARIIERTLRIVVSPTDPNGFVQAAETLLADEQLRRRMGSGQAIRRTDVRHRAHR